MAQSTEVTNFNVSVREKSLADKSNSSNKNHRNTLYTHILTLVNQHWIQKQYSLEVS